MNPDTFVSYNGNPIVITNKTFTTKSLRFILWPSVVNGIIFVCIFSYSIGLRAFLLLIRIQKLVHGVKL
jgi:hypothetical protein